MTKCINPTCPHSVPPGWSGGYCLACCAAIERSEDERQVRLRELDRENGCTDNVCELVDPHEEFGFDYWWEV